MLFLGVIETLYQRTENIALPTIEGLYVNEFD